MINEDGTRRHADGRGVCIPRKLYDWIKENLPDFNLPDNRIIYFKNKILPDFNMEMIIDIDDLSV